MLVKFIIILATRKDIVMKNKLIIALLIASMAVSFTACGKGDDNTTEAVEQTTDDEYTKRIKKK